MLRTLSTLFLLVAALTLAACDDSSSSSDNLDGGVDADADSGTDISDVPVEDDADADAGEEPPPSLTHQEAERAFYELTCEHLLTCEHARPYIRLMAHTVDECAEYLWGEGAFRDPMRLGILREMTIARKLEFNGEAAYACLEAKRTLSCEEYDRVEPLSCAEVFMGTAVHGEACESSVECLNGWCRVSQGCPGVCLPLTEEGGACQESEECVPGAKCVNSFCTVYSAPTLLGSHCEPKEDWCAAGTYCDAATKTCVERLPEGEFCSGAYADECEDGTVCMLGRKASVSRCRRVVIHEAVGDYCGESDFCADYLDLACAMDGFPSSTEGSCVAAPQYGDVCYSYNGSIYTSCSRKRNLYCYGTGNAYEDSHCRERLEGGEACSLNDECVSEQCQYEGTERVCAPAVSTLCM